MSHKQVIEKRVTRGKRINVLAGEEAVHDSTFYANPMWEDDQEGDSEFSDTKVSADEFDSDFNESETSSDDDDDSDDGSDAPTRKRKKKVTSYKRKLKMTEAAVAVQPDPDQFHASDDFVVTAADEAEVSGQAEDVATTVGKLTKTIKTKKIAVVKPKTPEVEGPPIVRYQENMLIEAAKTELESATWLSCLSLMGEELNANNSKRGKSRLIPGQEMQYIRYSSKRSASSSTTQTVITFPDSACMDKYFRQSYRPNKDEDIVRTRRRVTVL